MFPESAAVAHVVGNSSVFRLASSSQLLDVDLLLVVPLSGGRPFDSDTLCIAVVRTGTITQRRDAMLAVGGHLSGRLDDRFECQHVKIRCWSRSSAEPEGWVFSE